MKKIFFPIVICLLVFSGNFALAADCSTTSGDPNYSPVCSSDDVVNVLKNILNFMYTIFFILSIIFVLLAAYNYLFAKDDPEKIKSATKSIMWAAVAIIIALVSVGANAIIKNFITGQQ